MRRMITLCLYNTYDKKRLHDIHTRSVARAAPVCLACGMTLTLLDFPQAMYETVEGSTTIGECGTYFSHLRNESRYYELHDRFPLGILVATTCHPDEKKSISTRSLLTLCMKKNIVLIIGLGRRGLPKEIRQKAHHHWDATGKGISLETCAAMGFIGGILFALNAGKRKEGTKIKYG
jgi:hypothetical protein